MDKTYIIIFALGFVLGSILASYLFLLGAAINRQVTDYYHTQGLLVCEMSNKYRELVEITIDPSLKMELPPQLDCVKLFTINVVNAAEK